MGATVTRELNGAPGFSAWNYATSSEFLVNLLTAGFSSKNFGVGDDACTRRTQECICGVLE